MRRNHSLCVVVLASFLVAESARATEICGNGIDDDSNGMEDEGCYPSLATGVCESPLSCAETGMVSWSTGSLHYSIPPDIAPRVPYGPGIGFRRIYTPMFTPGSNPASVNKTPLGPGWQHTYLTYVYRFTVGQTKYVTWHTSQGRDVLFTFSSQDATWEYYKPQYTDHVLTLKYHRNSPNTFQVQLITGETIVYNTSGQVSEIWDTLGPTPNKVLVTWTSTSNGNVSTVTDAQGKRRLLFNYTGNLLTNVKFQISISGTWTSEHSTDYAYADMASRDPTSGWYVPVSSNEWTALLSGTGIANPGSVWGFQESNGSSFADSINGVTLTTVGGAFTTQQSVAGWSRKAIYQLDTGGNATYNETSSVLPDLGSASQMVMTLQAITNTPSALRGTTLFGSSNWAYAEYDGSNHYEVNDLSNNGVGTVNHGTVVVPEILRYNKTAGTCSLFVDSEKISTTFAALSAGSKGIQFGAAVHSSPTIYRLYAAAWYGAAAELSDAGVTTLVSRIKNGSGAGSALATVTIGGQLAQKYYYTNGNLTQILDGSNNNIVAFTYDAVTAGKVVRVDTPRGTVGFEYASTRTGCVGTTILYFNKGNATSCSADADCGTGYLCGGKTGASGATGTCFLAGRCMTTSTAGNESVVTNISPLGAGGGSCTGACTDVAQYVWTTPGPNSPTISVIGTKDPLNNYTSASYNVNTGLPLQIGYGDTNSDPTDGGTNRTEYLTYDSLYPGRIAEVRRQSDLTTATCSASVTTGCDRMIYTYNTNTHMLSSIEHDGFTLDSSGNVNATAQQLSLITYTYDTKGRVTEIDKKTSTGTVLNKTLFNYFTSTDQLKDQFLQNYQVFTDGTNYLQPNVLAYDFWGNATSLQAPDGNLTCDSYDSARGFLSSRRHAMAGQTDCGTTNSADLTASWARDSALRLTQLTRPDGSCVFYTYDASGRLYQTKRRDDCNASSSGDTQQVSYTADSQVAEIDTYNASSTLTAKRPYTYFNSRRLQDIVNPSDTSKFTGLVYDAAGKVTEVDGPDSLSKTVYHFDNAAGRDGRVTSEERYKTSSTSDTWSLLYAWMGDQSQVTDGDSKVTGSTRDDSGRLVKITSADLSAPTVRVFDVADRLTTMVEDLGGSGQQIHTFTYDYMNRQLGANYQGACPTGTPHAEIQRTYDALSGVTCPMTGGCNNLQGRLAYVQVTLMCSSDYASTDGSLDQFTFYSYDKAGRLVEEYITDDTGRVADHLYEYTKNGRLSKVTTPSGAVIGWTFGSTGNNSDTDLITGIYRTNTSTPIIDTVQWNPFGPIKTYNWETFDGSYQLRTDFAYDLAYRMTVVDNGRSAVRARECGCRPIMSSRVV